MADCGTIFEGNVCSSREVCHILSAVQWANQTKSFQYPPMDMLDHELLARLSPNNLSKLVWLSISINVIGFHMLQSRLPLRPAHVIKDIAYETISLWVRDIFLLTSREFVDNLVIDCSTKGKSDEVCQTAELFKTEISRSNSFPPNRISKIVTFSIMVSLFEEMVTLFFLLAVNRFPHLSLVVDVLEFLLPSAFTVSKLLLLPASMLCTVLLFKWIKVLGVFKGRCTLSTLNHCLASAMKRRTSPFGVVIYLSDILLFGQSVYEDGSTLYVWLECRCLIITHNTSSAHALQEVSGTIPESAQEVSKSAQQVSESRLMELILTSRHKIVGSDFMPANDESWISEGLVTRERLLRAVLNSGHFVLEASSMVDSCLRENGSNQRAALEWLSFLRWSKCKAGMATCYDDRLGKLRIDTDGSLVQDSSYPRLLSFFFPFQQAEFKTQALDSAVLEKALIANGSRNIRRFLDQRNFVFASRNQMFYARGDREDLGRRSAMLISLIRLTGAARFHPRYVEVVVPNSVHRLIAIPPVFPNENGNVWIASDTLPNHDGEPGEYNISGAQVYHGRMYPCAPFCIGNRQNQIAK